MADLNRIIDELSKLTVVEAAELSKQLEEKWGVTAAATVVAAPTGAGASGKIIFNFSLKRAQEQGYFKPISFLPIREYDFNCQQYFFYY